MAEENFEQINTEAESGEGSYNAESITVLEDREAVRKRPGMYIGGTGIESLHHLVYEIVDNSIDEAMAGFCTEITVKIKPDNIIEITDDGRGIPVDMHEAGVSALEVVMSTLHAGGKMDNKAYQVSGGLHGVGASVVNFLSEFCEVYVHNKKDNKIYYQRYIQGIKENEVEVIGDTEEHGTIIIFKPDLEIFPSIEFSFDILATRLRELAYLNSGVVIKLEDLRGEHHLHKAKEFFFEGGIVTFISEFNKNKSVLHKEPFHFIIEENRVQAEVAMQYNDEYNEKFFSYVNSIRTIEGGQHVSGFRAALTRSMNDFLGKLDMNKKFKSSLSGDDIREGLACVLSIKMPDPMFEGQTKSKLGNTEIRGLIDRIVTEGLNKIFDQDPIAIQTILQKSINAYQAREAARKARESARKRKSALESSTLPGKLADCSEKNPERCELFIVEGDSAGGSAKQGRNREFQAILPLWGKMLNVEKAREEKIINNDKLTPVIITLGTGFGKDEFDLNKLRYHKIIIMADADVDGSHIRTLLLTFFYRYMPELIENGHIYFAMPPLYKIQSGKKIAYAYDEEEREKILREEFQSKKPHIQRYKGLGEMNPDQLWETTMDPDSRKITQIELSDAVEADTIFTTLMGDKVEPRRNFIEEKGIKVLERVDV